MTRRRALFFLGAAGAAGLAACATSEPASTSAATASTSGTSTAPASTATAAECIAAAPQETAGPYPGDGSNGPNVLIESGVVRKDITTSFGSYSGTAEGVPATITLRLQDLAKSCAPGAGMAVYLWHCDRAGRYSLYSEGATDQNYLRGVQVADADGQLTFTSIFPACYTGRWPHLHFEVYDSLETAVAGENARLTSQIALPQDVCEAVYNTAEGYSDSIGNLSRLSLESDGIFGDGWDAELATATGSVAAGYDISITIGVAEKSANTQSGAPGAGRPGPGGPPPGR
jgi:protocatechuate 3,4-dioxygenase beta subunit